MSTDLVSFDATAEEQDTIHRMVTRAEQLDINLHGDRMALTMDITACHANGNPLRLDDLLAADNFNFGHDIIGIQKNLCRDTGALMNCFSPRYTQRQKADA